MQSVFGWIRRGIPLKRAVVRQIHTKKYALQEQAIFTTQYQLHHPEKMRGGPSTSLSLHRDDGFDLYRHMVTIRRIETEAEEMYTSGHIGGFFHLYSGQEACAVGIEAAITKEDAVITGYRTHGWAYARGVSPLGILAEVIGRSTGCAKGKGGSMHMYGPNFYGGAGIVGSQIPVGAGIAFALKYKGSPNVCVTVFGDGASNQGQMFEAFNMAKLWNLPCVFVCENNRYALGTRLNRASASPRLYTRGDYLPGIQVDGMDVLAVREATSFAKEYALKNGPILIEADTYRFSGHSNKDPGTSYRQLEEVCTFRKNKDPIKILERRMISSGIADSSELEEIHQEATELVREAVEQALVDPTLPLDELYTDTIADPPPCMTVRGCDWSMKGSV